jgi:hypothetical protein
MKIGGHDENCDVFQPAPDGGPSLKPCNCRKLLENFQCTGLKASWCPVCGDCRCDKEAGEKDNIDCPLHSWLSVHATCPPDWDDEET